MLVLTKRGWSFIEVSIIYYFSAKIYFYMELKYWDRRYKR
jgi:hypothetical protein